MKFLFPYNYGGINTFQYRKYMLYTYQGMDVLMHIYNNADQQLAFQASALCYFEWIWTYWKNAAISLNLIVILLLLSVLLYNHDLEGGGEQGILNALTVLLFSQGFPGKRWRKQKIFYYDDGNEHNDLLFLLVPVNQYGYIRVSTEQTQSC